MKPILYQMIALVIGVFGSSLASAQTPIAITAINRTTPVSFEKEVLPILQKNCLACHSTSEANGELVLETPQGMLKGGDSGPAIVPAKGADSLMLKMAAHQVETVMPPPGNDVAAKALTSQELGLLKLWIDQGAQSAGFSGLLSPQKWRPLPPGDHPIYTVAISPDGQFAACGRANQIFIYHVSTGQLVTRLTDPKLQAASKDKLLGIAHLDVVQSLAINKQGDLLASGGFRTVKLWRYPRNVQRLSLPSTIALNVVAVSPDRGLIATVGADNSITLWSVAQALAAASVEPAKDVKPTSLVLKGHVAEIRSLCFSHDGQKLISSSADKTIRVWNATDGSLLGRIDTPTEVNAVTTFLLPPPPAPTPVAAPTAPAAVDQNAEVPEPELPPAVELIASGGVDNLIRVWKMPTQLPQQLAGAPLTSNVLATSRDGKLVALANATGLVRIVDAETNTPIHQWQAHTGAIHDLAFNTVTPPPVVPAAVAPKAAAAEANTPKVVAELPITRLASAGADGTVRVWVLNLPAPAAVPPVDEKPAAVPAKPVALGAPKLQRVLRGSLVAIQTVDFRADGKQLVAGAADGAVTVWDLETTEAKQPQSFEPADSPATIAVVSPDGKLLATTGTSNERPAILVRNLESGKIANVLLGHSGPVKAIAFSNDNTKVVSGSDDKTARVWDLNDAKFPELARFAEHTGSVTAVAFKSDGLQVVSGSADKSVKLWSVADTKLVMNFAGHTGAVVAVAMPSTNQPVSASSDKTIRFWNAANGQATRTLTEAAAVTTMIISRDSARLAVAIADKSVKVYQPSNGSLQLTLKGFATNAHALAFSLDNKRLVSGMADHQAMVWDMADGRLLEIIPVAEIAQTSEPVDPKAVPVATTLTAVAFGAQPDRITLANSAGIVAIQPLRFAGALRGMVKPITSVVFHPTAPSILAGCEDGTVRGFNSTTFAQAFSANHAAPVHDLAISADGTRMASAGENKLIRLWNPANGAALQPAQLTGFTGPVRTVCFSADGTRVVGGSGVATGELLVFNVSIPTGLLEQTIVGHAGAIEDCIVTSSAVGRAISASVDGTVLSWDLLGVRQILGHSQPVTSLAAIPLQPQQPPQILSGSLDNTARRWNALTGQQLAQLNHGGPVTAVAVRPDGLRLASASTNKTVKLWNTANNQQLAEMRGNIDAKTLVAKLTQQKIDATAKVAAAKVVLDAATKALPVKATAEKTAATALAAANTDVTAKTAILTKTTQTKGAAEKLAIEAAAVAQKAATILEQANQKALDLIAQAALLAEKATQARAVATANPANQASVKAGADATLLATTADTQAKAATAAKAVPTKAAADTAAASAAAVVKALATNKPFTDALAALTLSRTKQKAGKQTHDFSTRDLKLATDAVPLATTAMAQAEAVLKQFDADLIAATKAETDAQQPVHCVAFSPDGRTLASGGDFGVLHTWDADTGKAVASYAGHTGAVRAVAYLSDAAFVSASSDKNAVVWDLNPSWRLERVIGDINDPALLIDRVMSVDFNPDGTLLATGGGVPSRSGELKIWKVADGSLVRAIADPHTDAVNSVAFSPDGQFLASAGSDKYVKKFDVATGKMLIQFEGHTNHVLGVTWRSGGKILASSGADFTIRTWSALTGDRIRTIVGYTKQITAVRFVGQTQFIVSSSGEPFVRKHNSDNGGVQTNFAGSVDYMYAIDATADPNNGVVVAGGHAGILRLWRSNGQVLHAIKP
jgi:WD40 repeat protein